MTKTQSLQEVEREKQFKQKRKTQLLKYETLSRQSTCNKSQHQITRNARTEEKVWQIPGLNYKIQGQNAPTSSPILTIKTAGPTWARQTFLKASPLNYISQLIKSTVVIHICLKKRQNDSACHTRVVTNDFNIALFVSKILNKKKMLTWILNFKNNCRIYYSNHSGKKAILNFRWSQKFNEKRCTLLNTRRQRCSP